MEESVPVEGSGRFECFGLPIGAADVSVELGQEDRLGGGGTSPWIRTAPRILGWIRSISAITSFRSP